MKATQFEPAWWLNNCHLQTIFPVIFRRKINLEIQRERINLPDKDFLDLDWVGENDKVIVLVLHGLAGSIESPYARGILDAVVSQGWKGVLMHFRGCSGEPNRLPRSYHSGETGDLSFVIKEILTRYPNSQLGIVGYSLGGNVLLKWLGETEPNKAIRCAVAVSVPFDLFSVVMRLQNGISRIYQKRLLKQLKINILEKIKTVAIGVDPTQIKSLKNFREFDQILTAPLHGFKSADEYYLASSSKSYLAKINVPTLIIHSRDDPFMSPDSIPAIQDLSDCITLELTPSGGHVGFVSGKHPFKPTYWLEERIPIYLKSYFI